jgi:hypothetical protein
LESVDGQLRARSDAGLPTSGILTDPIAFSTQQQDLRDQEAALRVQIKALLPPDDAAPSNVPVTPSGEAVLLPLVSGNSATLLLLVGNHIDAVPLPDLSGNALRQLYQRTEDNSRPASWSTAYSQLTTTTPSSDLRVAWKSLPAAWREAEANLGDKLWVMFGDSVERELVARGLPPGARVVILPTGLLAQLPIWLARDPKTGESLGERYDVTITPSLAALGPRPSTLSTDTSVAAWFNEDAIPNLQLSSAARLLFQEAVPNANLISREVAATPQSVIPGFEGARVWQFWTHGRFDKADVTRSGLQLAGRTPEGQPRDLTVGDLLATEFGDRGPDLVILSACETGLPDITSNDELIGLQLRLFRLEYAAWVARCGQFARTPRRS